MTIKFDSYYNQMDQIMKESPRHPSSRYKQLRNLKFHDRKKDAWKILRIVGTI
uniref:Uncharacterized protein n=1 Tax=Rhizophora mucronata TaxID=61149 RepID=A0A2P2M777_RHIMU